MSSAGRLLVLASAFAAAHAVVDSVTLSKTTPSGSQPLDRALVSFSLEQDRWTDWVGTTSVNQFWLNAMDNLRARTGEPPWIRVGANSEDKTFFDPNTEFSSAIFPNYSSTTPYPEASKILVGDGYYGLSSHVLPNTHMIWGLNLGANNLTDAYLMAKSIFKAFQSSAVKARGVTLDFVELGNEPDLYMNNGLRNSSYNYQNYVNEFTTFANNITASFPFATTGTNWLGGSFAGSSHVTTSFSPQAAISHGILNSTAGKKITTWSQHRYSGSFCSGTNGLLQELMRKSNVRGNLTDLIPDIAYVKNLGLRYVGGEMNSLACHGAPGVSNTAGAALWTLDYTLFAATLGISQVFFHEGIGFKYNLVQPISLGRSITTGQPLVNPLLAHVQPQYYGGLVITEAIGTTGSSTIVELTINDPYMSGYAIYEHGSIARAVFINSLAYFSADSAAGTNRSSTHVSLAGMSGQMTIKRTGIMHADDTQNLTWAGQSFETRDATASGAIVQQTVDVSKGVDVSATEAVLLTFV